MTTKRRKLDKETAKQIKLWYSVWRTYRDRWFNTETGKEIREMLRIEGHWRKKKRNNKYKGKDINIVLDNLIKEYKLKVPVKEIDNDPL